MEKAATLILDFINTSVYQSISALKDNSFGLNVVVFDGILHIGSTLKLMIILV